MRRRARRGASCDEPRFLHLARVGDDAMKYLRAQDIADELGVSRTRAYEIMHECTRVLAGRSIRVTPQAFAAWKERHTWQPHESPSTSAEISGGAASGIRAAASTIRSRRAADIRSRSASVTGGIPRARGRGSTSSESPSTPSLPCRRRASLRTGRAAGAHRRAAVDRPSRQASRCAVLSSAGARRRPSRRGCSSSRRPDKSETARETSPFCLHEVEEPCHHLHCSS